MKEMFEIQIFVKRERGRKEEKVVELVVMGCVVFIGLGFFVYFYWVLKRKVNR